MDVFVNSTFAQSMRGYRLMRMYDNGFSDIASYDELPAFVCNFFKEDLFRMIWCETADENSLRAPVPTGGYLGIKGFSGVFENQKKGIVNIAFYAQYDEIFMLADIANKILCNYNSFSGLIFRSFHIDTAGNYSVNKQEFMNSLEHLPAGNFPYFVVNTDFSYRNARQLLHAAVCTGSRERAIKQLPGKWSGFRRPTFMIDENEFETYINEVR